MSSLGSTPGASITGDVKVLDEFNIAKRSKRVPWLDITGSARLRHHLLKGDSGREGDGG